MFSGNDYSLSDIAAVSRNDDMWGGNGGWIWILLILLLVGGNGWGRNNGVNDQYTLNSDFATLQRQISDATATTERKLDSITNGICDSGYANAQLINGVNTNIAGTQAAILTQMNNNATRDMQDSFGLQTAINNGTQSILGAMTANEAARQNCCCETNNLITTGFGNMKYDMATQACQTRQAIADSTNAITVNQDANTRSILKALQDMQTAALQDKINALTADNQALRLAASQQAQNNYLVHTLAPQPTPAFLVPNPVTGQTGYNNGYCACGA